MKILLINGPNMQLLGKREPEIYGKLTLEKLEADLKETAAALGVELVCCQSNHEGNIVDKIGAAPQEGIDAIIINPAAYTHTSIAIHDALKGVSLPAVEVHISNIGAREGFRHASLTAPACTGIIAGLGVDGYEWALRSLVKLNEKATK
ncbi:MAG: type II 3-dehydroquinate dehydratase [Victivallaceae bacterium]|nr:type II 3-dehydroquinate dehydratase [Victivallaceae bacterium]